MSRRKRQFGGSTSSNGFPRRECREKERCVKCERAITGYLWSSWHQGRIIDELACVFAPTDFIHAEAWLSQATLLLSLRSTAETIAATADERIRRSIISAYRVLLEDAFVCTTGLENSRYVSIIAHERLILRIRDEYFGDVDAIERESVVAAIAYHSRLWSGFAGMAAQIISLSLPAYPRLFPNMAVELTRDDCRIVPKRPLFL